MAEGRRRGEGLARRACGSRGRSTGEPIPVRTSPLAEPMAMLIDTVCHSGDILHPRGIKQKAGRGDPRRGRRRHEERKLPPWAREANHGAASCRCRRRLVDRRWTCRRGTGAVLGPHDGGWAGRARRLDRGRSTSSRGTQVPCWHPPERPSARVGKGIGGEATVELAAQPANSADAATRGAFLHRAQFPQFRRHDDVVGALTLTARAARR